MTGRTALMIYVLRRCGFGLILAFLTSSSSAQQFRALWVDGWGAGFKSASEVAQLVADARRGNFNAVVVQVRRRGDAFYNNSPYEPKTADGALTPASFDSLAELIARAHNTNTGPRIEVHAWVVTYNIWNNQTTPPPQATHPYNLHRDWLTQTSTGTTWDGDNYAFDPGHPEVQKHTFNVAMDIITRYDIDGFNWDYIRYADTIWGYNPVSVARFNQKHGLTGLPARTQSQWMQFRRDQVTSLVRKVYLSAMAIKPQLKVSADTITWAPGVTTDSGWTNNARAYTQVLQDWRSWMEEGIIDINMPMTYFDMAGAYVSSWNDWNTFAKQHRYNRHVAIGPGLYMNTTANAIAQVRQSLAPAGGSNSDGVCGYSYRVVNRDGVSRSTFIDALVMPSSYDPISPPVFASLSTPPSMPWKTAPTKGHLKGFVYADSPAVPVDGANLTLVGSGVIQTRPSDATGFYGWVDLAPGNYSVIASGPGMGSTTQAVTIRIGAVTNVNLIMSTIDNTPPVISGVTNGTMSPTAVPILWTTDEPASSRVEFSTDSSFSQSAEVAGVRTSHLVSLTGLDPQTMYRYRVKSMDARSNSAVSPERTFTTPSLGQVSDIIIDNASATVVGSWSTGSASGDKWATDYRYKSQGTGSAYVEFRPNILTAGLYQVYAYYPQGPNRPTNAPIATSYDSGVARVELNQQTNGGKWNLVGTYPFGSGTSGWVRVRDDFVHDGKVVMADAIKFVFVSSPMQPPVITGQPQSQTVVVGAEAEFTVTATGTDPRSYQWRYDGNPIVNATGTVYRIPAVQEAHAGSYTVRVSNSAGTNFSAAAVLTVLPPPVPHFESIAILQDGRVRLVIGVEFPTTYILQKSTNGVEWVDEITVNNSGETFEYFEQVQTNAVPRFYRTRSGY